MLTSLRCRNHSVRNRYCPYYFHAVVINPYFYMKRLYSHAFHLEIQPGQPLSYQFNKLLKLRHCDGCLSTRFDFLFQLPFLCLQTFTLGIELPVLSLYHILWKAFHCPFWKLGLVAVNRLELSFNRRELCLQNSETISVLALPNNFANDELWVV